MNGKKAVRWRGVTIGEGLPKVIVSVMGGSMSDIAQSRSRGGGRAAAALYPADGARRPKRVTR